MNPETFPQLALVLTRKLSQHHSVCANRAKAVVCPNKVIALSKFNLQIPTSRGRWENKINKTHSPWQNNESRKNTRIQIKFLSIHLPTHLRPISLVPARTLPPHKGGTMAIRRERSYWPLAIRFGQRNRSSSARKSLHPRSSRHTVRADQRGENLD